MTNDSDTKIELQSKDDEGEDADNCYCATVLRWEWSRKFWYNSGIVVRDPDPLAAVKKAINMATEKGIWK